VLRREPPPPPAYICVCMCVCMCVCVCACVYEIGSAFLRVRRPPEAWLSTHRHRCLSALYNLRTHLLPLLLTDYAVPVPAAAGCANPALHNLRTHLHPLLLTDYAVPVPAAAGCANPPRPWTHATPGWLQCCSAPVRVYVNVCV